MECARCFLFTFGNANLMACFVKIINKAIIIFKEIRIIKLIMMYLRMLWEIELSISLQCLPNIIRGKYMADVIRINLPTIIGATLGVVLGLCVSATALYSIGKGIQYLWGMELWELISRGNLICKVISTRCGCSCVFNKRREIPARWWFLAPKNCLVRFLWNIGTAPVDWTFDS